MLIGELSKHSGFSRDTIRYYEKLGLIAIAAERKASSGYKSYTSNEAERLNQIRCLKDSGFTLSEIQQLLLNDGKHPVCRDLPEQLADKILRIDEQLALLSKFKASLVQIQRACGGACGVQNGMPDCVPMTGKAKPTKPTTSSR